MKIMEIALIGSRTTKERNGRGDGLTSWEMTDGKWSPLDRLPLTNPSWLAKGRSLLTYVLHGDGDSVSVVEVSDTGTLTQLQEASAHGENPVHCTVVRDDYLVVANYATGTVVSFPIENSGLLGEPISVLRLSEELANFERVSSDVHKNKSHPHQIIFDAASGVIYVPDKGLDVVFVLSFTAGKMKLREAVSTRDGSGPRHGVVVDDMLYVVGELDSTLISFKRGQSGEITLDDVLSLLPSGYNDEENSGAGICFIPGKNCITVSNRGKDGISIFTENEKLELSFFVPCSGPFPRFISTVGDSLIVAHERGDTVTSHHFDDILSGDVANKVVASTGSPVCVLAIP